MKTVSLIIKIVTALAAVIGCIYVCATYGDKIVAWAKKMMAKCPCKCDNTEEVEEAAVETDEAEVVTVEAAEETVVIDEEAAEEAAAEVDASAPIAEESDFED